MFKRSESRSSRDLTPRYHSYNKDDGIDCYERDFIDDTQLVRADRDLKSKKTQQKRRRQRSQVGRKDSEGDSTNSEEEGICKSHRRTLQGSHRKPTVRESSEEESEGSLSSGMSSNGHRVERVGREGRCSEGSDEGEELVQPTRGKRRKRSLELFDSGDDSKSDQQEALAAGPHSGSSKKKKRLKQLESDDEIRYYTFMSG